MKQLIFGVILYLYRTQNSVGRVFLHKKIVLILFVLFPKLTLKKCKYLSLIECSFLCLSTCKGSVFQWQLSPRPKTVFWRIFFFYFITFKIISISDVIRFLSLDSHSGCYTKPAIDRWCLSGRYAFIYWYFIYIPLSIRSVIRR